MATLTLVEGKDQIATGLNTYQATLNVVGQHTVRFKTLVVPASGLSVVVNLNASPILTMPALGVNQIGSQFRFTFQTTSVGDVLTVVVTSASAVDSVINNVKTTCSVGLGII